MDNIGDHLALALALSHLIIALGIWGLAWGCE